MKEITFPEGTQTAVRKAVTAIRQDSLSTEPGTLLGQEGDLIARYGVSRPTLRQAAALVGQEQLVRVRRGVGGGYFASRPDFSAVAHMAAILLQVEGAKREHMLRAIETIRFEMVHLAALNITVDGVEAIEHFLKEDEVINDENYSFKRFLRAERQHNDLVGQASGDRVLRLFMQILLDLVGTLKPEQDMMFGKAERFLEWRTQRNKMLRAVLLRDAEVAMVEARRCSAKISDWLEEDAQAKNTEHPKRATKASGSTRKELPTSTWNQ